MIPIRVEGERLGLDQSEAQRKQMTPTKATSLFIRSFAVPWAVQVARDTRRRLNCITMVLRAAAINESVGIYNDKDVKEWWLQDVDGRKLTLDALCRLPFPIDFVAQTDQLSICEAKRAKRAKRAWQTVRP